MTRNKHIKEWERYYRQRRIMDIVSGTLAVILMALIALSFFF